MAASPSSIAATSDIEQHSSPHAQDCRSFVSQQVSDDEDMRLVEGTPDTAEKAIRGRSRAVQQKDITPQQHIGKIRHLKKEDGEPLWRDDIQYDFLKLVFDNEQKVFTNSYDPDGIGKQNFADLYVDTMSRSSKTSKVLRDKLLSDREAAKGMAMVCLLVNVNRMNTTLNFFPEMRAQLRTYHAIPSLQAHQDPNAYKQLQDAPRLKSILKGGIDDREEPTSLEDIKRIREPPRTNPVSLIFVLCNNAQKIAELHFPEGHEFHDLIMKTQYSSQSRARAFLWLMWFYLESDYTEEGCEENPFGAGVDYNLDVANQGVPELELMSEEQRILENVDTQEEIDFGREKQKTRAKILEMDQAFLNERETKRGKLRAPLTDDGPAILPRIRPSKNESDMDSTRSTPPPRGFHRATNPSRRAAPLKYQVFEGSSPARQGPEGVVARKPRPPTAHQLAVERNRNERVEYILDLGLRRQHHKSRKLRRQDGAIFRAYRRLKAQEDGLEDSEVDDDAPRSLPPKNEKGAKAFRERGLGGLCLLHDEDDDFGEEVSSYAAAFRRSMRRLSRWRGREVDLGVILPIRKRRAIADLSEGQGDLSKKSGEEAQDEHGTAVNGEIGVDEMDADETAIVDEDDAHAGDDGDDADRTEILADSDTELM